LPVEGIKDIRLFTSIGLEIAIGYKRIVFNGKTPYIEVAESNLIKENICIPENQKWRITNTASSYIEYRSKDYCNVKIMLWKYTTDLKSGMYYISPFDLKSDQIPILIEPLYHKGTLQEN
jgi:hypothetical protein